MKPPELRWKDALIGGMAPDSWRKMVARTAMSQEDLLRASAWVESWDGRAQLVLNQGPILGHTLARLVEGLDPVGISHKENFRQDRSKDHRSIQFQKKKDKAEGIIAPSGSLACGTSENKHVPTYSRIAKKIEETTLFRMAGGIIPVGKLLPQPVWRTPAKRQKSLPLPSWDRTESRKWIKDLSKRAMRPLGCFQRGFHPTGQDALNRKGAIKRPGSIQLQSFRDHFPLPPAGMNAPDDPLSWPVKAVLSPYSGDKIENEIYSGPVTATEEYLRLLASKAERNQEIFQQTAFPGALNSDNELDVIYPREKAPLITHPRAAETDVVATPSAFKSNTEYAAQSDHDDPQVEDLDLLAAKIKRILDEQARRHGIDV